MTSEMEYFPRVVDNEQPTTNNKLHRLRALAHQLPAAARARQKQDYVLYFDGCSKGSMEEAGAGAVLYENGIEIWSSSVYVGDKVTLNIAEYYGLILGLSETINRKIKNICVKSDNLLVIEQMRGEHKVRSARLQKVFDKTRHLISYFDNIVYEHVHRSNNQRAYELSNDAVLLRY
jgi:ribonuclease HI